MRRTWIVGLCIAAGCGKAKDKEPDKSKEPDKAAQAGPDTLAKVAIVDDGAQMVATFDVLGPDGAPRPELGTLTIQVFDDDKAVCSTEETLLGSDYHDAGHGSVRFSFETFCPTAPAGAKRRVQVALKPNEGPPTAPVAVDPPPSLATPPPPPPPPALAEGDVAVDPLPVVVHAPGATLTPDPEDPETIVVHAKGCDVTVARADASAMKMDGPTIKALLASGGAKFSKSELTADRWDLEFTTKGSETPKGIHTGFTTADAIYLCRGDYKDAKGQACGAAVCATFKLR